MGLLSSRVVVSVSRTISLRFLRYLHRLRASIPPMTSTSSLHRARLSPTVRSYCSHILSQLSLRTGSAMPESVLPNDDPDANVPVLLDRWLHLMRQCLLLISGVSRHLSSIQFTSYQCAQRRSRARTQDLLPQWRRLPIGAKQEDGILPHMQHKRACEQSSGEGGPAGRT